MAPGGSADGPRLTSKTPTHPVRPTPKGAGFAPSARSRGSGLGLSDSTLVKLESHPTARSRLRHATWECSPPLATAYRLRQRPSCIKVGTFNATLRFWGLVTWVTKAEAEARAQHLTVGRGRARACGGAGRGLAGRVGRRPPPHWSASTGLRPWPGKGPALGHARSLGGEQRPGFPGQAVFGGETTVRARAGTDGGGRTGSWWR